MSARSPITFILAWAFTFSMSCTNAQASSPRDLLESKEIMEQHIRGFRVWIRERGSDEAKSADSIVRVVVENSILPMAGVSRSSGQSQFTIMMTSQFGLLLDYFAEVNLLASQDPRRAQCANAYKTYVFDTLQENAKRSATRQPILDIDSPESFARIRTGQCGDFYKLFPIATELREPRENAVKYALLIAYFHELGHVAKRHSNASVGAFYRASNEEERLREFLKYTSHSRSQEYEADRWAADQLTPLIPPHLILSSALFDLVMASAGLDCGNEDIATHPTAANRLSAYANQVRSTYEKKWRTALPQPISSVIDDINRLANRASRELKCKP